MLEKRNTDGLPACGSKRIVSRTCIACRRIKAKREMVRLVRTVDGSVEIDPGGKKAGRGAYLCLTTQCWHNGLQGGKLEHALHTTLSVDNRQRLNQFGEGLKEPVGDERN